jgi:hypothetical protein
VARFSPFPRNLSSHGKYPIGQPREASGVVVSLVSSKNRHPQLPERSSASCEPKGQAFAVAAMPIVNTAASATLSGEIFGTLFRSWFPGFVGALLFLGLLVSNGALRLHGLLTTLARSRYLGCCQILWHAWLHFGLLANDGAL